MDTVNKRFAISRSTLHRLGDFAGEDKVLASVGERVLKVSEATYQVLEGVSLELNCEQIAERINERRLLTEPATGATVEIIEQRLQKLLQTKTSLSQRATGLWARMTVLRFAQMRRVLIVLQWLFANPMLFYVTFAAALIGNGVWMAVTPVPGVGDHVSLLATVVFLAMATLSLVHELCHAAAAYRFKIQPASIGVGLYLCVPVFYTDITGIWCLPAHQRIIVNLAGVYGQLLLNLPLQWIAAQVATPQAYWVIATLGWMNVGTAIVNLIPFAKLDGYWVVADWIGSAHLQRDASTLIKTTVRRALGRPWEGQRASLGMFLYATGQMLVYGSALWLLSTAVVRSTLAIYQAKSASAAMWQLISGSPAQAALCAFLVFKLLTKLFSRKAEQIGEVNG